MTVRGASAAKPDDGAAERFVAELLPYIRYTARRLAWRLPPSLSEEDLVSAGVTGLLEALRRFDEGRVKVRTYAEYRIRGAMLDALRAADIVPRSARDRMKAARLAYARAEKDLGRMPDDSEVAREMGIEVDDYRRILGEMGRAGVVRFEDVEGVSGDEPGRARPGWPAAPADSDPLLRLEAERRRRIVAEVVGELPEKERLVVSLYYGDEMTMKEIAEVLRISEGRVCQLHGQAILRMRARLDPECV